MNAATMPPPFPTAMPIAAITTIPVSGATAASTRKSTPGTPSTFLASEV
jgi:hypothetical protein